MDSKSRCGSAATASSFLFSELLIVLLVLTLGAVSATAQTVTFTGAQSAITSFTESISPITVDSAGNIYTVMSTGSTYQLIKVQPSGNQIALNSNFPYSPLAIGVDPAGSILYFIHNGNTCPGHITWTYVSRTTISGNSAPNPTNETCAITSFPGWNAAYTNPLDLKVDASKRAYIADFGAGVIWRTPASNTMPDSFLGLTVGQPYDIAMSADMSTVYFTYQANVSGSWVNAIGRAPASFGTSFTAVPPTLVATGLSSIQSGLVVDYSGVLYVGGTDSSGDSVVFKVSGGALTPVTPPASNSSLYSFGVDLDGKLYTSGISSSGNPAISTTSFTGIGIGSTNIGWTSAAVNLKFFFNTGGTLGSIDVLDEGSSGLEFRNAGTGTCKTTTSFNANDTCTVNVTFTPAYAGLRQGAVVLKNATGTTIATVYVYGIGAGPQVAFSPATESVISGLQFPYGVAVDAVGNVFIADSNNNRVLKETPSGASYTETVVTTNVSNPTGVAVDGAGNLYIADSAHNRVLKETPTGSGYTETTLVSGLSSPTGVAVDGSGNVYIADKGNNRVLKETFSTSGYGQSEVVRNLNNPTGVAVDDIGTVYIADSGNARVIKETPSGAGYIESVVANTSNSLVIPTGVAVSGVRHVYIADTGGSRIVKAVPAGASYTTAIVADGGTSGLISPTGVAVGGNGTVYIADKNNSRVVVQDVVNPSLDFGTTTVGVATNEKIATVTNIGNATLTFKVPGAGTNPSVSTNFAARPGNSTPCPLLTPTSSSASLAIGASCTYALSFNPTTWGNISGSLAMMDNALPSPQSIALKGTGAAPIDILPAALVDATFGSTYSIVFTASGGTAPYTFSFESGSLPPGMTLASDGTLSGTPSTVGVFNFTVGVKDAINAINTKNYTLAVGKGSAAITLSNLNQTYTGSALAPTATTTPAGLSVALSYTKGGAPVAAPIAVGTYDVTATINDSNYQGSTTGTLVIDKGTATVTLSGLNQTYNGSARSASATTTPAGLTVQFTYDGNAAAPTNAGSYAVVATINDANYQGTANGTLTIGKATATVTLGGLNQTYNGTGRAATASTVPAGLTVNFTYDGSVTAPTNAGTYTVVGTINDSNYQGSATGNLVIAKADATVTLANLSQTYTGSALTATATTNPGGLAVTYSYAQGGSPVANPIGAGNYAVTAAINDTNYQGTAAGTLVIAKASATLALGDLDQTYTGSPLAATATTNPAGLGVTFTYNGAGAAPANAGTYAVVGTINDANYQGSTSGTLVIGKATATVVLGNLSQTYTGSALNPSPTTTPAGLSVTYAYTQSGLPVAAAIGAGTYGLTATINDTNYQGSTTGTLFVDKATAMVTLGNLTQTYNGSARVATATTTPSGLLVDFSYDGLPLAPTNAGSYAVVGTVIDANYRGSAAGTLLVNKASATVTLGSLSQTYTGGRLDATSTTLPAGLNVTYSYLQGGNPANPIGAGSYFVVATINDSNYQGTGTGTFVIAKAAATVTLGNLSQIYTGSALDATAATNPPSLAVAFTYNGAASAPTNAGSYTVVGTINDANYQGTASGTLVIGKAGASVTLGNLSQTYTGSPLPASATTAPSGLTVNFTYDGSATAPTNAGSYTVVGTINDVNYQGSATGTLVIAKAPATVTLGSLSQTYDGSPRAASATTTPSGLTVNFTYDGSATSPTNAASYAVVGTINDSNYQGSASGTLVVGKAPASVTLSSLNQTYNGSERVASATTTPSGLTVDLTYDGSATAPVGAGSYTVVGTINDTNYQGTSNGTLVVAKAVATVAFGDLNQTYNGSALSPSATTVPAGLNVEFTYGGSSTAPTNAGSHPVVGTINDANYQGSGVATLVIGKAALTVTPSDASMTYGSSATNLSGTITGAAATDGITANYATNATSASIVGDYDITASLNDPNLKLTNYDVSLRKGTMTVTPAALTVIANNASTTFNADIPNFTGTVTGVLNNDPVTATYASPATKGSSAGTYAITPTLVATPAVLANYAVSSTPGTLTIDKAPGTVTALTSSATTYYFGQSLTFTATASNSAGTPDGSVSFYDGATLLGSVALSNGTASYVSSNLIVGTHSVTAVYAGSANYAGATSNAVSQVVQSAAISINDSGTPGSIGTITIVQGGTGSTQFRIASLGTLNSAVSLACAGFPAGIDCQLSPSTINVSGLPATVTATVSTTKYKMVASNLGEKGLARLAWPLALMLPGLVIMSRKRKRAIAVMAMFVLALILCMSACGGGSGITNGSSVIPAGTYTGTITATSTGATSTTSNLTVVVQ